MPNPAGKTTFGRSDYTDGGVNFFSDEYVTGFTPLMQFGQSQINGVYNVNDDGELLPPSFTTPTFDQLYVPPAEQTLFSYGNENIATTYNNEIGEVDFFNDQDGMHVGFTSHQPKGLSMYIKDGGGSIIWGGSGKYSSYEGPGIEHAFDIPNQPLEPTENLEQRASVYSNIDSSGTERPTLLSEYLPGQVKTGNQIYDSLDTKNFHNHPLPENLESYYSQVGSTYSIEGKKADIEDLVPNPIPNFAEQAWQHGKAFSNSKGGGIESMILKDPEGKRPGQMAVGMGIEATGGGEQDLQALSEPMSVDKVLDSSLNNINSNYNNNFNGIL